MICDALIQIRTRDIEEKRVMTFCDAKNYLPQQSITRRGNSPATFVDASSLPKMRALDTCRQCGVFKRGLVVIVYYDEVGSVGQAIGCFLGEMHQLPLQRLWVERYPSILASHNLH